MIDGREDYTDVGTIDAEDLPHLRFTPVRDLLAEPDEVERWLVADRVPIGGLVMLAGKPKAGKSTLARNLALCVSRGAPFLGWPTTQGTVWYMALEEKRSELRRHFASMGASSEPLEIFADPAPAEALRLLRERIDNQPPVLIVVDPLQRFIRSRDLNDYASVTSALDPLLHLARQTSVTVLLVHHMGKGDRNGSEGVLGSTALHGSVDNTLMLRRNDTSRLLSSEQRYGPDLEETALTMDETTGVITSSGLKTEVDRARLERELLDAARLLSAPAEEDAFLALVEGGNTGVKRKALRALVEQAAVVRTGEGKRGSPFLYQLNSRLLVPTL